MIDTSSTMRVPRGTTALPTSRVNRIIKADDDVNLCSKEAIFLIAKATERMIEEMTTQSHATARLQKRTKLVKYSDLATTATLAQWFYLGVVMPAPIPLKSAKALRQQQNDADLDAAPAMAAAGAGSDRAYEGKRIMKGKKRASLAAAGVVTEGTAKAAVEDGAREKRQTRGKQVKYSGDLVGGEDDEEEEEGDFDDDGGANTSEAGEMDVDG